MKTLLTATDLSKTYGRQEVLRGLNLALPEKARIALIGRNGSGKSTLLRILAGEEEADDGNVALMPVTRLGVLSQNEKLPGTGTAVEYLSAASGKPDWECRKLASRFGLTAEDLAPAPAALSGGYQMRLKIVRLLLTDPNLLLLDEPVNYLDLPTLLLLEAFLRSWSGAYVITSHDREVLQNLCTATWEIERGKLTVFPGDVETYLDWKEEQAEYARRTNKKLRREMAAAQAFADRFRAKASLASRAQSKIRHIAKLRGRLRDLDPKLKTAAFHIPCPIVHSGPAVRCIDLAIGYGAGSVVAKDISLEIPRGAKVAIVGENGRGKTTLLKTLVGALQPLAGHYKWWHRADIGYFSQEAEETLSHQESVLETLTRAAPPDASGESILATAGAFLFGEDDLEKPCGVLSGGERARVRLARLVLGRHNVLVLDEPTNHLDAETVEVLARALKEYAGTVLVVSHSRTFTNALVDRIYEVCNGTVRHYSGTYEEYVADLAELAAEANVVLPVAAGTPDSAERREKALAAREMRRARQKLEDRLKKLEKEKGRILAYFFENPTDYAPDKAQRLKELEEAIGRIENDWLKLAD